MQGSRRHAQVATGAIRLSMRAAILCASIDRPVVAAAHWFRSVAFWPALAADQYHSAAATMPTRPAAILM